ncbi:hypothetical protein QFC24_001980 [Naganishia onofrii]|uniref:Uncharacterized protein n=1 Tax=Naganishia onofrii TaxID=1851511 RepID=A0ACC2XQV2_9TREE|nr:hypothetical protein QFC24_001980 [Naganishia onofrii]
MFGHHLLDLADSEQEILEAFACFDEHDEGVVDVGGGDLTRRNGGTSVADGAQSTKIGQEGLRGWLRDYGDKMSDAELDRFFSGPFMDKKSQKFDYMRFAKTLKVNDAAEVEQQRPLED